MTPLHLRCSFLPTAFACPGSVHGPGLRIEQTNDAATLGTAAHAVLADICTGDLEAVPDLTPYANRYGLGADEVKELSMLCWTGLKAWSEIKPTFGPDIEAEVELGHTTNGYRLTGHIDLLGEDAQTARIVDWKSGRLDVDHYHQMAGYAALTMDRCPCESVVCAVVLLREQSYRLYRFTRPEIEAWWDELLSRVVQWDGRYCVGPQCRYCPRRASCEARTAMVRSSVGELLSYEGIVPADRTELAPRVLDLYHRVKTIKAAVEAFDEWLRTEINANGPVVTGESRLEMVEQKRDNIDPLTAWPTLEAALTTEELARATKVSKTAILQAISDKAPRGQKKLAKDELMRKLEEAGAVSQTSIYRLTEIPNEKGHETT